MGNFDNREDDIYYPDIISSYDKETGFYTCYIYWQIVLVDEDWNYFNEDKDAEKVPDWDCLKRLFRKNQGDRQCKKIARSITEVLYDKIEVVILGMCSVDNKDYYRCHISFINDGETLEEDILVRPDWSYDDVDGTTHSIENWPEIKYNYDLNYYNANVPSSRYSYGDNDNDDQPRW